MAWTSTLALCGPASIPPDQGAQQHHRDQHSDRDQEHDEAEPGRFAARQAKITRPGVIGAVAALAVAADTACKRIANIAGRRDEFGRLLRPPPTVLGV